MDRGLKRRLFQLDFSAAFDRVSHRGMLYKLRFIGIVEKFLSIVAEFLSDRRQYVRLNGKVSESVDVVLGVPQGNFLGPLLFILYISELFRIVSYEDDTTIYAVIPISLSRPQVVESRIGIGKQSIPGV